MACVWRTPVEALNAILLCAQGAMAGNVPSQIVVGTRSIGDVYSCCDGGLLAVEYDGSERTLDDYLETNTSGSGGCRDEMVLTITVSVRRCTASFEMVSGVTLGGAVSPEARTAAGLEMVREAWAFITAFNCCRAGAWKGCRVEVVSQDLVPVGGQCFGHDTVLAVTLGLCCP